MNADFGKRIRERREALCQHDSLYTLRQVAATVGVTPSFLSKVERGALPPPSEDTIKELARVLGENADVLLAMAGKVSSDLKAAIVKRPKLIADLIRLVQDTPDEGVLRIVREVRDGKW